MKKFTAWLSEQQLPGTGHWKPDPGMTTVKYTHQARAAASPSSGSGSSWPGAGGGDGGDTALSGHCDTLKAMQNQLRDLFGDIRNRLNAFRRQQDRSAFEREMLTAYDSVGRSHAILLPSARGAEEYDI